MKFSYLKDRVSIRYKVRADDVYVDEIKTLRIYDKENLRRIDNNRSLCADAFKT